MKTKSNNDDWFPIHLEAWHPESGNNLPVSSGFANIEQANLIATELEAKGYMCFVSVVVTVPG